jgi:type VI protein secretion system component VasK
MESRDALPPAAPRSSGSFQPQPTPLWEDAVLLLSAVALTILYAFGGPLLARIGMGDSVEDSSLRWAFVGASGAVLVAVLAWLFVRRLRRLLHNRPCYPSSSAEGPEVSPRERSDSAGGRRAKREGMTDWAG